MLPFKITFNRVLIGLVIALTFAVGVQTTRITLVKRQVIHSGFRGDSIAAVLDTTRQMAFGFQRRALQAEIARDSIAKELGEANAMLLTIGVQLQGDTTTSPPVDGVDEGEDGTRTGTFRADVFPAHIQVEVALSPPEARLDEDRTGATFQVTFDPIWLKPRVTCGKPSPEGVRPASVLVEAPVGVKVDVTEAVVDPETCNAKAVNALHAPRHSFVIPFVAGGVTAAIVTSLLLR